jgi:hypothetical protein
MTDDAARLANLLTDPAPMTMGAVSILRGVQRLMRDINFMSIREMPLANGRRADVLAINPKGAIWIVEIKSCIADFRTDQKWPEYRDYCDGLLFAVAPDFPAEILPDDAGLIFADAYGGEIMRPAPAHLLPAARRKAVLTSFAMTAARRLQALADPPERIIS